MSAQLFDATGYEHLGFVVTRTRQSRLAGQTLDWLTVLPQKGRNPLM